jgi:hypothetical protein
LVLAKYWNLFPFTLLSREISSIREDLVILNCDSSRGAAGGWSELGTVAHHLDMSCWRKTTLKEVKFSDYQARLQLLEG